MFDQQPISPNSESVMRDLAGRRVTVMGLGRHGGGVAAVRYLSEQGAVVTVTDLADEDALQDSLEKLADLRDLRFHLGAHHENDFSEADVLVVNPAVKPDNRFVQLAIQSGAEITSEIELFMNRCPARIIGVTGSNGKSTTVTMIASILNADGRNVELGGNIGGSLLPQLGKLTSADWVVLELSSFQLHWLSEGARRPDVAIVTNCTANHLDWHADFEAYRTAKQKILTKSNEVTVNLNGTQPEDLPSLQVPGEHNRRNAAFAAAVANFVNCSSEAIDIGLRQFRGLPHRLEDIGEVNQRRFVNDSQATTTESTIAAIDAMTSPFWLLAGGADKGASFDDLAETIVQHAAGVACYGATGPTIQRKVLGIQADFPCTRVEHLEEAFDWCVDHSASGDVVLLSPGCSSLDQYRDYAHRAAEFRRCMDLFLTPQPDAAAALFGKSLY